MTRLADRLAAALTAAPPPADGLVEVLPAPLGAPAAIVAFTAHHVIAADVDPVWVGERCRPWDLAAPFSPAFVSSFAARIGAVAGTQDVVLIGPTRAMPDAGIALRPATPDIVAAAIADSPHVRRGARVLTTLDGLGRLLLGRGLEDRWEVAIHVEPRARGRGIGRALAAAAPTLVGPGEPVFAQIAPGNVASLRAALAAGYRPVAAEVLFFDPEPEPGAGASPGARRSSAPTGRLPG